MFHYILIHNIILYFTILLLYSAINNKNVTVTKYLVVTVVIMIVFAEFKFRLQLPCTSICVYIFFLRKDHVICDLIFCN